jgi:hypothetical protein
MPSLITWILAVYGIAFLLSDAKILSDWIPVRPLLIQALLYLPAGAAGAYLLDLIVHYIETRILMTSLQSIEPEEE